MAEPTLVELIVQQREGWKRGDRPRVEDLLARAPALGKQADAVLDLVYNEVVLREQAGESPRLEDYQGRFPHLADELRLQFEVDGALTVEQAPSLGGKRSLDGSTVPYSPSDPEAQLPRLPGCLVLGELGRGAMGVVYRAWQKPANRVVALKVLAESMPAARVRTEVEAAARLQHPNIVQVFEVRELQGRTCLVLEYVEGGSLAERVRGRPQPPRDAARFLGAMAKAMAYAHEKGVVHRDLKPANVLLDGASDAPLSKCDPKISDFGLAKLLVGPGASLTRTNDLLGTPCYMAPEQAEGKKDIGPAADVYSLGAILYELLTGRPPFVGATVMDTLAQVVRDEPVPPRRLQPKVPRDLETICLKCLHKPAARRYGSAEELAADLRAFDEGRPVRARPVGPLERTGKWAWRNPALAALLLVVVLAGVAPLAVALHFTRQVAEQRDLAQKRADELDAQLGRTRRLLFTAQLLRVGAVWEDDPIQGQQMLEDEAAFPPDLRDFTWGVLHTRCKRYRLCLEGHERDVQAVAFRPDGAELVSGGRDGLIKWWSPATGVELASRHEHTSRVSALAFSPKGAPETWLVSGSYDGSVKLWDVQARVVRHVLIPATGPKKPARPVQSLAFSPDGKLLAVNRGERPSEVSVWDVAERQLRETLAWPAQPRCPPAFTPDGKALACAVVDHKVRVWDLAARDERRQLRGHATAVTGLAFSPDGQVVAAGAADGVVRLWDVLGADLLGPGGEREGTAGAGPVSGLAYSPDGRLLAVAYANASGDLARPACSVRLWGLARHKEREPLRGHRGSVLALAFSPDGKAIATGGDDRTVRLWDVAGRPEQVHLEGHDGRPNTVAQSADGSVLAWVSDRPRPFAQAVEVTVWDVGQGKRRSVLRGHEGRIACLAMTADGKWLATASGGEKESAVVNLWDLDKGMLARALAAPQDQVQALAFRPDGATLAGGCWDRSVVVWDVKTGRRAHALTGHKRPVLSVCFSPDGRWLASGDGFGEEKGEVRLWGAADGALARVLPGHARAVLALAFRPGGGELASGGGDGIIKLWDVASGQERARLSTGGRSVQCLAFSPDGEVLASGGAGPAVKLWDAVMAQDRASLPRHDRGWCFVGFHADGRALVTVNAAQTAQVWYAGPP